MSFFSLVLAVVAITPLIVHIVSMLYTWLLATLSFINNLLLATFMLMWILLQILFTWLQTVLYMALSPFNTLVTLVWTGIKIPFVKFGTFLYKLGSALLSITQLTLCIVYYGLLLCHLDIQIPSEMRFHHPGGFLFQTFTTSSKF